MLFRRSCLRYSWQLCHWTSLLVGRSWPGGQNDDHRAVRLLWFILMPFGPSGLGTICEFLVIAVHLCTGTDDFYFVRISPFACREHVQSAWVAVRRSQSDAPRGHPEVPEGTAFGLGSGLPKRHGG